MYAEKSFLSALSDRSRFGNRILPILGTSHLAALGDSVTRSHHATAIHAQISLPRSGAEAHPSLLDHNNPALAHVILVVVASRTFAFNRPVATRWKSCWTIWLLFGEVGAGKEVLTFGARVDELDPGLHESIIELRQEDG